MDQEHVSVQAQGLDLISGMEEEPTEISGVNLEMNYGKTLLKLKIFPSRKVGFGALLKTHDTLPASQGLCCCTASQSHWIRKPRMSLKGITG